MTESRIPLPLRAAHAAASQYRSDGLEVPAQLLDAEREYWRTVKQNQRRDAAFGPPCGTLPAYTRHLLAGEEPCGRCRNAEYRAAMRRSTGPAPRASEIRDPAVPYRWRARRYGWAVRVLAASEAKWGKPGDDEVAA